MSRIKNPLYVVTNHGKDVQEAASFFDALIKKFGLEKIFEVLDSLLKELLEMVTSYAFFLVIKEFVDELVNAMEFLIKKIDPVLAFSLFQK